MLHTIKDLREGGKGEEGCHCNELLLLQGQQGFSIHVWSFVELEL
jgi:hypothetical protein